MFQSPKYITKGIQAEIPFECVLFMWLMIEEAREHTNLDYLQIFTLSPVMVKGQTVQQLIHHQEQPPYSKTATFLSNQPITAKIYCIDDGTHCTMLLASEY